MFGFNFDKNSFLKWRHYSVYIDLYPYCHLNTCPSPLSQSDLLPTMLTNQLNATSSPDPNCEPHRSQKAWAFKSAQRPHVSHFLFTLSKLKNAMVSILGLYVTTEIPEDLACWAGNTSDLLCEGTVRLLPDFGPV